MELIETNQASYGYNIMFNPDVSLGYGDYIKITTAKHLVMRPVL